MAFTWDTMQLVNLVLCIIVLALGSWGYRKSGNKEPLYIALAFGLFGISHLVELFGLTLTLESPLIVVRTAAYLIVVLAVYSHWRHERGV
ncbi:MAG: hypothetical protein ACXQT3_01620 [Methermicoccaceae archaeon]